MHFPSLLMREPVFFSSVLSRLNDVVQDNQSIKVDIHENDSEFKLLADLPGAKKEDIKVDFKDDVLSIAVEIKSEKEEKSEGKIWRLERSSSKQQRRFHFDTQINVEAISAKYENGVLSLTLPKKEVDQKALQITIK